MLPNCFWRLFSANYPQNFAFFLIIIFWGQSHQIALGGGVAIWGNPKRIRYWRYPYDLRTIWICLRLSEKSFPCPNFSINRQDVYFRNILITLPQLLCNSVFSLMFMSLRVRPLKCCFAFYFAICQVCRVYYSVSWETLLCLVVWQRTLILCLRW